MSKKIIKTKNISISTKIPAPGTDKLIKRLNKVESRSMHGQLPIVWSKAKNFNVYDIAGNKFIDFTSTIFVANTGHSNNRIKKYISRSLNTNLIHSYAYINKIRAEYLERLIKFCGKGFEKAFLMSAGTEATEAAFKLMRMYGQKKKKRRLGIICFEGNWHGRTMASQMMSGNDKQKEWIGYHDKDIHHIAFPYPWLINEKNQEKFLEESLNKLKKKIDLRKDVSGIMIETFQGWGAIFYPKDFVKAIETICKKHDILLTFDEMQAGFGRTGRNFGFQHYDVIPDLICVGKGMGGGVALSGVIGREDVMDLPEIGNMSSTHSANPLVCAAGLAVLHELESRDLVYEADRKGRLFRSELEKIQQRFSTRIPWILGEGMIMAMLFQDPVTYEPDGPFTSRVAERCMQKGLLVVHTGRESLKFGPPLTISDDALLEGVAVLCESIEEVAAE